MLFILTCRAAFGAQLVTYRVFHNSAEFILKRQRPNCVLASINQTSDANATNQHLLFAQYIRIFKFDALGKQWNLYCIIMVFEL